MDPGIEVPATHRTRSSPLTDILSQVDSIVVAFKFGQDAKVNAAINAARHMTIFQLRKYSTGSVLLVGYACTSTAGCWARRVGSKVCCECGGLAIVARLSAGCDPCDVSGNERLSRHRAPPAKML